MDASTQAESRLSPADRERLAALPADLAAATDDIVRGIRRFEAHLRRSAAAIDTEDFAHHLRTVLPGLFERP